MSAEDKRIIELTCPCCKATLEVDTKAAVILSHQEAKKDALSFEDRLAALDNEQSERNEKFAEIEKAEQARKETADQRFADLLEKAQSEPLEKPVRDIDLD